MFVTHLAGMWLCIVTHHILCWRYLWQICRGQRTQEGRPCLLDTNKRQGDTLEALEAHRSCDIVHVKLRNMFTTVYKYQQHTPPDSQVSYRRLEEQLTAKDSTLQERLLWSSARSIMITAHYYTRSHCSVTTISLYHTHTHTAHYYTHSHCSVTTISLYLTHTHTHTHTCTRLITTHAHTTA